MEEPTVVDPQFNTVSAPVSATSLYAAGDIIHPTTLTTDMSVNVPAGCSVGAAANSRASFALALFLPLALGLAIRIGIKKRA